jgi:hypothetical protein
MREKIFLYPKISRETMLGGRLDTLARETTPNMTPPDTTAMIFSDHRHKNQKDIDLGWHSRNNLANPVGESRGVAQVLRMLKVGTTVNTVVQDFAHQQMRLT